MSFLLITGATGFVGGHLAEACVQRGLAVRALVRRGADLTLLQRLGLEPFEADLTQPVRLREAVDGAEAVIHCAAKVGDWGSVEEYRQVNVEGLRTLLEACRGQSLRSFVHLSSLGVYAARHHYGTDESEPLPQQHVDGYTQSKVEAEQLALTYQREHGLPVVVLRPGFIYGPRDRIVLPQLLDNLRQGRVRYLGSGAAAMNTVFVRNLVDAIFLALDKPEAVGQVYNLTDGERVSKRRFIETLADGMGVPRPPWLTVPLWLARVLAGVLEGWARRRNHPRPPILTQARLKFLGLNLDFSIDKARRELGYRPAVSFEEGMAETVRWYRAEEERLASEAPQQTAVI
jgi:nucleoside-diphosphate-sugar epimerase